MKGIITFLLYSISIASFAQTEVKTVVHKGEGYQEQYDVKMGADTVKHGPYKRYESGHLKTIGTYIQGNKNHMWTYYYSNGKKQSEGLYADNEQVGLWAYYDKNGKLIQKYHHTQDSLHYFVWSNPNEDHFVRQESGTEKPIRLSSPPIYLGGNQLAVDQAYADIVYPESAKEKGITGMVYITFWVTTEGEAIDHKIHKDLEEGCGEEALRAIKNVPQNWIPGTLDGKKVEAKYFFPVYFKI